MAAIKRTKIINRARIMREIRIKREICRVEIARSLGLDKSTISNNVNELLEMGVIVESSEGSSGPRGGRKPVHIKLNKSFGCVLGLEIGPESFTAVAVDLKGEVLYSRFEKTAISGNCFMEKLGEIADLLIVELERKDLSLLGVGLGIGLVINGNVHFDHDFSAGEFKSIMKRSSSLGQFSLTENEQRTLDYDVKVRDKFLHELGAHVGLLVNTFNLTHIILGGSFERCDQEVIRIFEEEIKKNWPYPYPYEVKKNIWLSSFGDQAVAYGAAGMVLNKLFSDIEIMEDQPGFRAHREGFRVF